MSDYSPTWNEIDEVIAKYTTVDMAKRLLELEHQLRSRGPVSGDWSAAIKAAVDECRRIAAIRKSEGMDYDHYLHMATMIEENLWRPTAAVAELLDGDRQTIQALIDYAVTYTPMSEVGRTDHGRTIHDAMTLVKRLTATPNLERKT